MKKTKIALYIIMILGSTFLFMSCAHHQTQQTIDQKLQTVPATITPQALYDKAGDLIKNSPDLTAEQRNQLTDLHNKTHDELFKLQEQSLKLRDLLITDMVQPNYSVDEITQIKKRLKKVEQNRLNVVFNAVDKASVILGRSHGNYDIMRSLDEVPDRSR